jgi:phage terminase small subunit
MALSAKQNAFINEYLQCWNASEAARRAGYSEKSARVIGHENLTKPDITTEIQRRVSELAMGPDEVLIRLGEQARNEHGRYITPEGYLDLPRLLADGKGHLIKGIKETPQGKSYEFYDAQAALVQIGKHHKLFANGPSGDEDDPIYIIMDR